VANPTEVADIDLSTARSVAQDASRHWGLALGEPFAMSNVSYVAPAGPHVVKVAWEGDDEALHEPDALALWDGQGAVKLRGRFGRAILEERAMPGTDLAALPENDATAVAVKLASALWRPACEPFRPVLPEVYRWLGRAERAGSGLAPLARRLLDDLKPSAGWVVHGDFHHHNILRHGRGYVAIDPKPYVAEREYDVPSFLWNPMSNRLDDRRLLEKRIAAFTAAGLDESRIRAWTVIRAAYLRPQHAAAVRRLLGRAL
jgi:streptomycin 6-kinase